MRSHVGELSEDSVSKELLILLGEPILLLRLEGAGTIEHHIHFNLF